MAVVLEIEGLSVRYGNLLALEGVNLRLEAGEVVGLTGPNGGGKTTLLRAILGLIPYRGRVHVLGLPPRAARRFVGYLPQRGAWSCDFPLSTLEVVLMGRWGRRGLRWGWSPDDRRAARRALRMVGMEELADRPFHTLSGGQKQRALLARALVNEPRLLLLDEPTSHVDQATHRAIQELLDGLRGRTAVLMVSHDRGSLERCDRVLRLNLRLQDLGTSLRWLKP